jgi:DNA processing protein
LLAPNEHGYPPRLALIDDPPPLLGARGAHETEMRPMIGIVGSRNASGVGLKFAQIIARDLGDAGFVIASGLARGIDQAGHRASLAGGTVAMLAGGHDRIYPPEHEGLLASIIDAGGGAISKMPLGHGPRARDFPRRNRLISGAALGILIVEAAHRSGSLITARRRDQRPHQAGRDAQTSAADIINAVAPIMDRPIELPMEEDEAPRGGLEPHDTERARIVGLLGPSPIGIDDLVRMAETSAAVVRTVLLELDMAGRLERHGGGMVSLN